MGLAAESETDEALSHGNPSKQILTRIEKSFDYARSKQRLRRYTALAATLLTVSFVAAAASYLYAQEQVARAKAATEISETARKEADEQARLTKQAENKRIQAEADAEESKHQTAAAQQQQELALAREREATDSAMRQEQISAAQRLALHGERLLSDRLDSGLLLTAESLSIYDTYETRNALLNALQRRPRLLGYLDAKTLSASGRNWLDATLSANGELFAVRDRSGVTVWDIAKGKKIFDASNNALDFALNPDGRLLAISTIERLFLWDLKADRELAEVRQPCKYVTANLTFDPTGKYLAFTCGGKVFITKTTHAEEPLKLPGQPDGIESRNMAFNSDGKMLAAVGEGLMVWDMDTLTAQTGWPLGVDNGEDLNRKYHMATFSPNGKVLITTSDSRDKLVKWDVAARKQMAEYDFEPLSLATFNRKGDLLALGSDKGTIRLLDATTMEEVETLSTGSADNFRQLIFTQEDRKLLSVGKEVVVWDMSDDQHLARVLGQHKESISYDQLATMLGHHKESIRDVAFTPDGKYLVSCGGKDEPIVFRDARSGEPVDQPFHKAVKGARRLSFGRGGKMLAMVTKENSAEVVQLWDVEKGQLINTPYRPSKGHVGEMALSPDGKVLAVGFFELIFLNAVTGRQLGPSLDLLGPESIGSLTFSKDSSLLAVGTSRSNILLIDARTLKEIGRLSLSEDAYGDGVRSPVLRSPQTAPDVPPRLA